MIQLIVKEFYPNYKRPIFVFGSVVTRAVFAYKTRLGWTDFFAGFADVHSMILQLYICMQEQVTNAKLAVVKEMLLKSKKGLSKEIHDEFLTQRDFTNQIIGYQSYLSYFSIALDMTGIICFLFNKTSKREKKQPIVRDATETTTTTTTTATDDAEEPKKKKEKSNNGVIAVLETLFKYVPAYIVGKLLSILFHVLVLLASGKFS